MIIKEPLIKKHSLSKSPKKESLSIKREELIKVLSRDKNKSIKSLSSKNKFILIALFICFLGSSFSFYMSHLIIINSDDDFINKLVFFIFLSTLFTSMLVFFGLVFLYIEKIIKRLNEETT